LCSHCVLSVMTRSGALRLSIDGLRKVQSPEMWLLQSDNHVK
jgi:hypothetical protein